MGSTCVVSVCSAPLFYFSFVGSPGLDGEELMPIPPPEKGIYNLGLVAACGLWVALQTASKSTALSLRKKDSSFPSRTKRYISKSHHLETTCLEMKSKLEN